MKARTGCSLLLCLAVSAVTRAAVPEELNMELVQTVVNDRPQRNHAVSPFLVSSALAQVWLGARGPTRDEMSAVMGLTGTADLNGYSSANLALSRTGTGVTTAIFNRIYVRSGFSVKKTFSNHLKAYFGAGQETFSDPARGADSINGAVARTTRDRIKQLVTEDNLRSAELVLVSALYFKGTWRTKFDPAGSGKFLMASGQEKSVPMMRKLLDIGYASYPSYDVVSVPYTNEDYSLLIVRPLERSQTAVQQFQESLQGLSVSQLYDDLRADTVYVQMPRFRVESEYELADALARLGMRLVFRGGDLGEISNSTLRVSSVIHKVFMEVNEKGTEAAGAVAVTFERSASSPRPVLFTVDRPFLAVLYNNKERLNLFSAMVAQP